MVRSDSINSTSGTGLTSGGTTGRRYLAPALSEVGTSRKEDRMERKKRNSRSLGKNYLNLNHKM